jgi:hypothetical protein
MSCISFKGTPGRRFSDRYHARSSRLTRLPVAAGPVPFLSPGPGLAVFLARAVRW